MSPIYKQYNAEKICVHKLFIGGGLMSSAISTLVLSPNMGFT